VDEKGWIAHWHEVYAGLVLIGPPAERNRLTPTDAHLDRLEERLGCRLPASYRAFVKVIGPGHLAVSFTLFSPGFRGAGVVDFLAKNKWQEYVASRRGDAERVRGLVAFGSFLADNQPFCWEMGDVRDLSGPEYKIVQVPRDDLLPLVPITDSFGSFIDDFCLGGGFWRLLGYEGEQIDVDGDTGEPRSIRSFWPVGGSPRSPV